MVDVLIMFNPVGPFDLLQSEDVFISIFDNLAILNGEVES
jgi:hypothetical protein